MVLLLLWVAWLRVATPSHLDHLHCTVQQRFYQRPLFVGETGVAPTDNFQQGSRLIQGQPSRRGPDMCCIVAGEKGLLGTLNKSGVLRLAQRLPREIGQEVAQITRRASPTNTIQI